MLDEFHRRPGVDCFQPPEPTVTVPGALQRVEFIEEETRELREAVEAGHIVKVADALADIAYAVYGTAWRFGIPLDAVIAEVHRSNMTKTASPGDGKAIKGPGYSPPNIAAVLKNEMVQR
jgi:predicted HAD superfamily Cof-like phosphohydrolase